MPFSPAQKYSHFYQNEAILSLAKQPLWTISGYLNPVTENAPPDRGKAPIDIRELQRSGRIRGAFEKTSKCLMTLAELVDFLPNAANNTYVLNAHRDHFFVLDIESSCPPNIAQKLLTLPAIYSEVSTSGQGYHLILPRPGNIYEFPAAMNKPALREEHGWYEILVDHWIIFTRNPIPSPHPIHKYDVESYQNWDKLYATLAKNAKPAQYPPEVISHNDVINKPLIPGEDEILEQITAQPFQKTLADFNNDNSRFEFYLLGELYYRLLPRIPYLQFEHRIEYTVTMRAWIIYLAITLIIPERAKHHELRRGVPLLLAAAHNLAIKETSFK